MNSIIDVLPEIYTFLPVFLNKDIPKESLATCDNCVMLKNDDSDDLTLFSKKTKCCTYFPRIPNYLVGAILSDKTEEMKEGRDLTRKIIKTKVGIFPHGIYPSKKQLYLYNIGKKLSFGKTNSIKCSFYHSDQGKCQIWKYRNAVCTTWFCKYVKGKDGFDFWSSLRVYISYVEDFLMDFTLLEKDIDIEKIIEGSKAGRIKKDLLPHELNEIHEVNEYNYFWGKYSGKEEQFYIDCFEIVKSLNASEMEHIGGVSLRKNLKSLEKSYKKMMTPLVPSILMKNPNLEVHKTQEGKYLIKLISGGFFEVPKILFDILDLFDGYNNTEEALKISQEIYEFTFNDELITSLYQHQILIGKIQTVGYGARKP